MSRRLCSRSDQSDDNDKYRNNNKRRSRSRSPLSPHSSYGFTSASSSNTKRSSSHRHLPASPKTNGFIPDDETRKFYDKPTGDEGGFWTSEDYTFRDTIAKDVRAEVEDDIESKNSDEESEEDPELAEYADRADMNDEDEEQRKTIIERMIPIKKDDDEKKKATIKSETTISTVKKN